LSLLITNSGGVTVGEAVRRPAIDPIALPPGSPTTLSRRSPMTRTITFTGARGGHGTTTVAAVVALHAARTTPTVLVSPDTDAACALLGASVGQHDRRAIDVAPDLLLTAERPDGGGDRIVVVDEGTLASTPPSAPTATEEHYLVLRGPCYVALATILAANIDGIEGIVLVSERDRSLRPADITDVLGIPVVATVTLSPQVARTIDAGLLPTRFPRLRDLDDLRALSCPLAASAPTRRSTPGQHTDLPLSHSDNGGEGLACRDLASRNHVSRSTDPATGATRAQHRTTRLRRRRVLHRRDRHFGRGLLLRAR
jgi:hypothetical protein